MPIKNKFLSTPIWAEIKSLKATDKINSTPESRIVNLSEILNESLALSIFPFPRYSEIYFVAAGPKPVQAINEKRSAVEITKLMFPSVSGPNSLPIKTLKTKVVNPININATIVRIVFLESELFKLTTPSYVPYTFHTIIIYFVSFLMYRVKEYILRLHIAILYIIMNTVF